MESLTTMRGLSLADMNHADRYLRPGKVNVEHFNLLVVLSKISSPRIIASLEDFLVQGKKRNEVCQEHNVSVSYFSIKLNQLRQCSRTVFELIPYYKL